MTKDVEVVVLVLVVVLESEFEGPAGIVAVAGAGAGTALTGAAGFDTSERATADLAYAGPEAIGTLPGKDPTGLRTFSEASAAGSVMLQFP